MGLAFPTDVGAINHGKTSRNYVFTDWDLVRKWSDYDWNAMGARYAVGQFEIVPTTGARHFQGYVELTKPMRFIALKKLWPGLGTSVWFGVRCGTATQARAHCMKNDTRAASTDSVPSGPFEFGKFVDNGRGVRKRRIEPVNNVDLIRKWMLEDGLTRYDVVMRKPHFANSYCSLINRLEVMAVYEKRINQKPRRCKVLVIQGAPGTGKSSTIWSLIERKDLYTVTPCNSGYFCHYTGEKVILFEDFDNKTLPLEKFKAYTDFGSNIGLKRKHKPAMPFSSELLVIITNHSFGKGKLWPSLKNNVADFDEVRSRVDMWCKYTKGIPPFTGFSAIRFRFQNVEDPTDPLVEWLGLFYPLQGPVTFEDCIMYSMGGGFLESMVKDVSKWVAMTIYILRRSMASLGKLCAQTRKIIELTPPSVKILQSRYEKAELNALDPLGVYAQDYDLIKRQQDNDIAINHDPRENK